LTSTHEQPAWAFAAFFAQRSRSAISAAKSRKAALTPARSSSMQRSPQDTVDNRLKQRPQAPCASKASKSLTIVHP
jgi:hypothetical protein